MINDMANKTFHILNIHFQTVFKPSTTLLQALCPFWHIEYKPAATINKTRLLKVEDAQRISRIAAPKLSQCNKMNLSVRLIGSSSSPMTYILSQYSKRATRPPPKAGTGPTSVNKDSAPSWVAVRR
jgi:hypothetical protein